MNYVSTTVKDRKLLATVTVLDKNDEQKAIEFQLDTAAACNTLNIGDYTRLGKPPLMKAGQP